MSRCQIELMNAGKPYPRTCQTCGLGGACVKGLVRGAPDRNPRPLPEFDANGWCHDMSAAPKLKPCPFCGGDNVKVFGPVGWYRQYGISHSCRTFFGGSGDFTVGAGSEAEAITAWNTRADLIDMDVLRRVEVALEDDIDALTHALSQIPEDANQRKGMEGALGRANIALTDLRAMMEKLK